MQILLRCCCWQCGVPVQPVVVRCAGLNSPDTLVATWNQTPISTTGYLMMLTLCLLNVRIEVEKAPAA